MALLAADTDKIKSEKLREAMRLAQSMKDAFDTSITTDMPPGEVRSDSDADIMKFLKNQIEVVTALLEATVRLSGSDIPPTDDIRQAFMTVEELNSNSNSNSNSKAH